MIQSKRGSWIKALIHWSGELRTLVVSAPWIITRQQQTQNNSRRSARGSVTTDEQPSPHSVFLMFRAWSSLAHVCLVLSRRPVHRFCHDFLAYWERLTKPGPSWERQRPVKSEAAAFKALREQQKKGACPTRRKQSLERTTWKCSSWTSFNNPRSPESQELFFFGGDAVKTLPVTHLR